MENKTIPEQPRWKKRTIRDYHLESDIFNQKPVKVNQTQVKNYYKSDIFHFNEDKSNNPKKTIKSGKCYIESGKEPEKKERPHKIIRGEQLKETFQKDWNTKRMRPIIRKEDSDNTLAYDLTKQPPKLEKTQKKLIKDPYTIQLERKGKKIIPERIKEDPGNTLAYH